MDPKRILIVSRHGIVRHGLRLMLHAATQHKVFDEAGPLHRLGALLDQHRPDLVILDVDHHSEDLRHVRQLIAHPARVVLLWDRNEIHAPASMNTATPDDLVALEQCADAVVRPGGAATEVLSAISHVLDAPVPSTVGIQLVAETQPLAEVPAFADDTRITPREWQVMELIRQGLCNKRIARALDISVTTVRTHRQKLMAKLGLRNAVEVAQYVTEISMRRGESNLAMPLRTLDAGPRAMMGAG